MKRILALLKQHKGTWGLRKFLQTGLGGEFCARDIIMHKASCVNNNILLAVLT